MSYPTICTISQQLRQQQFTEFLCPENAFLLFYMPRNLARLADLIQNFAKKIFCTPTRKLTETQVNPNALRDYINSRVCRSYELLLQMILLSTDKKQHATCYCLWLDGKHGCVSGHVLRCVAVSDTHIHTSNLPFQMHLEVETTIIHLVLAHDIYCEPKILNSFKLQES